MKKPNETHLVVGGHDGLLTIRRRTVKAADEMENNKKVAHLRGGTYKFFLRGSSMNAEEHDVVFQKMSKKPKLQPYEKFLKSFDYGKAFNAALDTKNPIMITSLIEELISRDGLKIALKDRDEEELLPTINFMVKYVVHPRYFRHVSLLLDVILGSHSSFITSWSFRY